MNDTYDFWLLDLDGTVVDVETSYIYEVCGEVGERLGVSFTATQAEHLWYGFDGTRGEVLADVGVDAETFWEVFHAVEGPERRAAAAHLYPDAATFVDAVDTPIGLVTHCQEFLTEAVLEALGIEGWFDTVVCCDEETGWKPEPKPLELAMADLGVAGNGHAGAMVGDDPRDVDAAHNAGIDSVHVTRHDYERLGGGVDGDHSVPDLSALVDA